MGVCQASAKQLLPRSNYKAFSIAVCRVLCAVCRAYSAHSTAQSVQSAQSVRKGSPCGLFRLGFWPRQCSPTPDPMHL